VRTFAATSVLGDSDQSIYLQKGLGKLVDVIKAHIHLEVYALMEDESLAAAEQVLKLPNPPEGGAKARFVQETLAKHSWAVKDGESRGRLSQQPVEVDEEALLNRGEKLFKLVELAVLRHASVPEEGAQACKQLALAHLWLGAAHVDDLSMRLQFCRRLGLGGEPKYSQRAQELKKLKNMPQDWDIHTILMSAESSDIAKQSLTQPEVLEAFQQLFDDTFRKKYTRDRRGHRTPDRLKVTGVQKVMNLEIWENYKALRQKVAQSWSTKFGRSWPDKVHRPITESWLESAALAKVPDLLQPLESSVNEAWLFHGTSFEGAAGITSTDFDLGRAGSSAGTLYGRGVYLAESCTKSDEYTSPNAEGDRVLLLCRATLGRIHYTAEVEPNPRKLEVKCGFMSHKTKKTEWYHSVLGDREKARGTFREFVLFNSALVYAAFIITYRQA